MQYSIIPASVTSNDVHLISDSTKLPLRKIIMKKLKAKKKFAIQLLEPNYNYNNVNFLVFQTILTINERKPHQELGKLGIILVSLTGAQRR